MGEMIVRGGNVHQDDDVTFNLLAIDLVEEWNRTMLSLRQAITRGGAIISGKGVTNLDQRRPAVKLNILVQGNGYSLSTSILIFKADVYGYSVLANGQWWTCGDCKFTHIGAKKAGFDSMYLSKNKTNVRVGPGSIYKCVDVLSKSDDPIVFEKYFKDLCLMFLESVRLTRIDTRMRGAFQKVEQKILELELTVEARLSSNVSLPAKILVFISYWGKLSRAVRNRHYGVVSESEFTLADDILSSLGIDNKFHAALNELQIVKC